MNAFEPGSSVPNFVPVGDIPGFVFKDDGGTIATMFDPKNALLVAQTQAGPKTPHRLAFGKDDPGFRAASVYREDQVLRQIGKSKGFGEVFGERMADIATFGAYGALADDDERDAQIRAYQNIYNPFASTLGTFGGIGVGLLFPYGTAAKVLGKGAMAAGKASGLVRSATVARAAQGLDKIPANLLGVTAKATEATADYLKVQKFSPFVQNYGGGLVSMAVAEAPLSMAVAAADIVDYNKEFSMQAFVADAGSLWLTGMAIGGTIGFTGAVLRKGAGGLRRGVAGETVKGGKGAAAGELAIDVLDHAVRRQTYKGRGALKGAGQATIAHRFFRWIREWGRKGARSNAAKYITGEAVDEARLAGRTIRKGAEDLHAAKYSKRGHEMLARALEDFRPHASTAASATMLDEAIENVARTIKAQRSWEIARTQFRGYQESLRRWLPTKLPGKSKWKGGGVKDARVRLDNLRNEVLKKSKNGNPFAKGQAALADDLNKILKQTNDGNALPKLFEAHKAVMGSAEGAAKTGYARQLRDAIDYLTNGDAKVMRQLKDIEGFSKAAGELDGWFNKVGDGKGWLGGTTEAREIADHFAAMQRVSKDLGFDDLMNAKLVKDAEVMARDVTIEGMGDIARLNRIRRAILFDEGQGYSSVLKFPTGPAGELSFGDELLETSIDAIIQHKKATGSALRSLVMKGAPRGAVSFAGVLAYRNMTQDRKRENFESVREIVLETAASPERMIDIIGKTAGKIAATDMQAAVAYSVTLATAQGYLLQQMPRSSDPLIGPEDYSMQEVDSYLETVGALESPASVIASAKDGSVSIEAVDAIRTVYPELYTDMVLDIVEFMQTRDWDKLNEAQRLGLDTFTGGALGVLQTYGPMPGPLFAQTPMQQQALGKNTQQSSPQMAHQQSQMNSTGSQKVSGL
jgi:hypothetical protein